MKFSKDFHLNYLQVKEQIESEKVIPTIAFEKDDLKIQSETSIIADSPSIHKKLMKQISCNIDRANNKLQKIKEQKQQSINSPNITAKVKNTARRDDITMMEESVDLESYPESPGKLNASERRLKDTEIDFPKFRR